MAKADSKLHFRCKCGNMIEAIWKKPNILLGKRQWIAEPCKVCHTKTDLSGAEVINCPSCQHIVLKTEKFCPECNQPLDISMEHQPITCPNPDCGVSLYLPKNYQGDYTCRICGTVIKADYIRKRMRPYFDADAPAKLIALPDLAGMDERGLAVYKEAGTQFPFKSRVQVSEGTYGLLLQNGVCQYPLSPGTHLLEDSKLTRTARFDAAMDGEEVVFNTEILCVAKALPEIRHTLTSAPIRPKPVDEAPAREFTVEADAAIRCTVDDAKAFAAKVGYRETAKGEMVAPGGWLHGRTRAIVSAAFDQAAREAFDVYASSVYAFKAELTERVREKVYSALADDGLSIDGVTLGDPKVAETEESARRQREYADKRGRIETVKLPDVRAMRDAGLVIYQHDKDCFEYKSRVQVSEGTYGLLLQNGACQEQLLPGSYPLAECALEGSSRYDAAMNGENVVFYSSLFSVINMLPGFEWYHPATFVDAEGVGDAPAREYAIRAEGTLRFRVDDAKAFAAQVGLRALSVAELFHAYRPSGQLPTLNTEIEKSCPGESKDGWLYTRVKSIMNAAFGACCRAVIGARLDVRQMDLYRLDFTRRLRDIFDEELRGTGLSVAALELSAFSARETEESMARIAKAEQRRKNHAELLKAAQTQFRWTARDMELHLADRQDATFTLSFDGDCRLRVTDDEMFFALPEAQKSQEAGTPDALCAFLHSKLETMIGLQLARLAQEFIDLGKIENPTDRYAYRAAADCARDEIDRELSFDGLRLHGLSVNLPSNIQPSKVMRDVLAVNEKREKLRSYAESQLSLRTAPIRVHMKDDPTAYVSAVFAGKLYLRVDDPEAFYGTSEARGFMASDPFVSAGDVTGYYAERINPLFADMIARIAQAIVDQTNADIRELHRLNGLLQTSLMSALADRVGGMGLRVASLDMGMPDELTVSENMRAFAMEHDLRSGLALQKEIERLQKDKTIFSYSEDKRVDTARASIDSDQSRKLDEIEIANMNSRERVEKEKAALEEQAAAREKQKEDRVFRDQMDRVRRKADLDRLVEEIAAGGQARGFDELQKEYERRYILREKEINQSIREAQLRQQGHIDAESREDQAKFARLLNAAESKRLLGEILHRIDESDLDWRGKLDEYDRLRRKVSAADQLEEELLRARTGAEADEVRAAADNRIRREENETYLLVGETKIKLDAAQTELIETIARYGEERRKRMDDSAADHAERRANLDFEHRMRERQEAVAQQMELLRQRHEHELALRDRDDKLSQLDYEYKKLAYTLDYLARAASVQGDVDKARFKADEEIKKAEAQFGAQHAQEQAKAEEARLEDRLRRDEEAARRATEYQKAMTDMQLALEKLRHETERNKDDNQAKVAIAQAQNERKAESEEARRSIEHLGDRMDKRYADLQRAMDKIVDAQNQLRDQLRELRKKQQEQPVRTPPTYTYPTYTPGQLVNPYNRTPVDFSVTGGLTHAPTAAPSAAPACGGQPGMAMQICQRCGKPCSAQATVCEHCGAPL